MSTRTRVLAVGAAVAIATAGVAVGLSIGGTDETPRPAVAAVASSIQAVSSSTAAVSTFTLKGAFTLVVAGAKLAEGTPCKGTGMYDDMHAGTPVKVYTEDGTLLKAGSLGEGEFVAPRGTTACTFKFSVADVPEGPVKYGVAIGKHGTKPVASDAAHLWVFFSDGP